MRSFFKYFAIGVIAFFVEAGHAVSDAQLGESLASFYPQIKASLSYQHSDNPAQAFVMIIA